MNLPIVSHKTHIIIKMKIKLLGISLRVDKNVVQLQKQD